ncbi:MAG: hypothetical protein OXG47_04345 [bacterium]|nr:hypothetical protein [bacterium]MCY3925322.1 hypothetical protein [bacterium]
MTSEHRIRQLLRPLTGALEADGYALEVSLRPGVIALQVVAGSDACDDCLVPREMMEQMFRARLPTHETGLNHDNVSLRYPEHH